MAKTKTLFVCTECGNEVVKWQGKCNNCGSWDTFVEQLQTSSVPAMSSATSLSQNVKSVKLSEISTETESLPAIL